jgi:lysophospholipase L1-like esterase
MIELQLESGAVGRVFARRRVWWMLAVLLMAPGLVLGQAAKKRAAAHAAAPKKSAAKKGTAKASPHLGGHAVTSHTASRSKGHTVVSGHGKRGASRYAAPAPVIRSRYGAARPVQETAQIPVARVPQQVPAARVPESQVPTAPIPEADAPGVAVQETTPADESVYADSVLPPAQKQPFRYPRALDSFFKALTAEQASKAAGVADVGGTGSIVRIMQFGDSHTAADIFTGQMRALMQAKFGNGGLGFQYAGHPFAGYRLLGSSRSQTSGWQTQGNRFTDLGDGDTGLGGIAISARRPGESVFLTTTCETLQVQYLRQPGGGALDFSDNGQPVSEIKTGTEDSAGAGDSSARGAGTFTYSCTPGEHEFQLITMDSAPVRLLGLVTEQAGVTYECLGINGAVAPLILKWNQQMFAEYLGERNPNLIVLAYGTNEAAESASRNDEYVTELHEVLQNLHRIVPGTSILLLGPYDRALKVGRGRHAAWQTQAAIDRIIADQKEACRVDGCAFYDQRARMGGPGTMQRWVPDSLAQVDHTHLTGTGYRVLANALYRDLMTAYNSYLATAGVGPTQPASAQ